MILKKASRQAIVYACKRFHYAKSVPANVFGYSVFENQEWCGVVLFGTGANNHIAMPYGMVQGEVIELVRVALNGKHGKTSQAVATALRLLRKDCPLVKVVVSYADLDQDHLGIIYQATNWIYEKTVYKGQTSAFIIEGKKVHLKTLHGKGLPQSIEGIRAKVDPDATVHKAKGKVKYIYPMTPELRQKFQHLHQKYIKNASEA